VADVGYWALVLTLIVSGYSAVASVLGARKRDSVLLESARNGAFVAAVAATAASVVLIGLLLTRDLSVKYVSEHVNSHLPTAYRLSAFWAGQEGSLLIWLWMVTLLTVALIVLKRVWNEPFGPYVLSVMAFTQAFLALVMVAISNPFELLANVPQEGQGLNPLLQNFWMVMHPPVVFAAYAAYTVPFALAIGGLAVGRLDRRWLDMVRRWALFAWLFLGAGILMGAYWAYLELGWGGYWAWDPVENSSLVPWLTGTALLHSLMMQQRREVFKTWNLWLVSLTFLLCMFATFVTRSGVIQSVHAFGRSPIGYYFLAFIALCLLVLAALISLRRRVLGKSYEFQVLLSRETSLLLTNLLLVGAALVVLVGTLFPALVELFQGKQATLDISFYERTVGPLVLATIALIGVCPWLAWGGKSSARLRRVLLPSALIALAASVVLFVVGIRQFAALLALLVCIFVGVSLALILSRGTIDRRRRPRVRVAGEGIPQAFLRSILVNHRRYGAHIVHLGLVLMALGITGSSLYQDEVQVALAAGETMDAHGYTIEYQEFVAEELPDRQQFVAVVNVRRGDRLLGTLRPEKSFYWNVEQWVTEVAIRTTPKEDLYVILAGFENDGLASLRVLVNPLVLWLWVGGIALMLGGVMAWWPTATDAKRPPDTNRPAETDPADAEE
jgi:cytochrome c-type biogenesis protein CcmF